jgi:DNA invertase Pin-like site-specific DNA recombinase
MKNTQTGDARTRAVIYVRISQDRTGAGLGVDRQREDCEALAKRNGWEVVEVYVDNDVSAFSGKKRKDYERMLADLDDGKATVVIVWHTDRLHRSILELEKYMNLCERRGVFTHTVQAGEIDLASPTGRMLARQLGIIARYESEHKGERVRRARQQKALAGEWTGGIRPFGWGVPTGEMRTKVDKKTGEEYDEPVLDMRKAVPEEKAAIAYGTDLILSGGSVRGFFRWLRDKGLRTSLGNEFTNPEQARELLLRPRNARIAVSQGREVGRGQWDELVSEDKFRGCVAILSDPARVTTPGNQPKWLGSLLYRCGRGDCTQYVFVTQSGGRRFPSYRCQTGHGGGRRAEVVDQYVEDTIVERLSRPDAHELLEPAPEGVNVAALQAEGEQIRARMRDLGGLFGAGQLELGAFTEGMETARAQLDGVTRQLARAATADPLAGLVGAPDVRAVWKALELDRKRSLLRALVEVTLKTPRPGRMPDGGYFDYNAVEFHWRRGERS